MPDVVKLINLPAGVKPRQVEVWLKLVAAVGSDAFGYTATADIGDGTLKHPANDGTVTFTGVIANADITPAGTVYSVTTLFKSTGTRIVEYVEVPDTAGPFDVADILTTVPAALPPPGATVAPMAGDVTGTVGANTIVDGAVDTGKLGSDVVGYVDLLSTIDGSFWTQGTAVVSTAMDTLSVVDGWVTCHTPDDGPNNTTDAAAHGCCYHDFGADFADDFEVEFVWSSVRPSEATPLIHVDLTTDEGGIGMWPGWDVAPGGSPNSIWALGYIGNNNTHFTIVDFAVLDAAELAEFSNVDAPAGPARIKLRSVANVVTVYVNGRLIDGLTLTVPVSLQGKTKHGFAIDNNQTDGATPLGSGGTRPADFPAGRGPWTISKVVTATESDSLVTRSEIAGALANHLSGTRGGTVTGAVRIVATEPAMVPTTAVDYNAFYAEYQNSAGTTIGYIRAGDDSTGSFGFQSVVGLAKVGLGAILGRPSIVMTDGTASTGIVLEADGRINVSDDLKANTLATEGVNGATQVVRLVGRIATGLPTSGVAGDLVLVTDTALWKFCTVAGSPGTWVTFGGTGGGGGTAATTTFTPAGAIAATNVQTALEEVDSEKVAKSLVDAKGDLLVGTAADTVARLAVSATNGSVLVADSTQSTGLNWATGDPFGAVTIPGVVAALQACVANSINYSRWWGGGTYTKIAVQVGVSSGNICVGSYTSTGASYAAAPNAQQGTSGSVACPATGIAEVSLTASTTWAAGDFAAVVWDNATATMFGHAAPGSSIAQRGLANFQNGTFPLPSTATPAGSGTTSDRVTRLWGVA